MRLDDFVKKLLNLSSRSLLLVATSAAVTGTMIIVTLMEWLLTGDITADFLLTGFVASLCVGTLVSGLLILIADRQKAWLSRMEAAERDQQILAGLHNEHGAFYSIIEQSIVPYALNDAEGNIVHLNEALTKTFGYTLQDIPTLEAWWPQAYPDPAYRAQVQTGWVERLLRHRTTGAPFEAMEVEIRCKDGSVKTVMASAANTQGLFKTLDLVVLVDVTAQKDAERLASQTAHQYRHMLDYAPFPIVIIEASNSTLIYGNEHAQALFGLSQQDGVGYSTLHFFTDPSDRERMLEAIHATGHIYDFEARMRTLGGRMFWASLSSEIVEFEGRPCVISCVHDIDIRKRTEELQRRSAEQYRQLIDSIAVPVAVSSLESGETLYANERCRQLFRATNDAAINHPVTTFYADPNERTAILEELGRDGQIIDREIQMRRLDGELFWGQISTTVIEIDGKQALLTSVLDIEARRHAEQALRSSAKRYTDLIENAPLPLVVTDEASGIVLMANHNACSMFLTKMEDFVGKPTISFYVDPERRALLRTDSARLIANTNTMVITEEWLRKGDGETFWASLSVGKIEFDGKPAYLTAVTDISERKKAEDILRDDAQRYRNLIDTAPFPIVVTDIEASNLLYANPRADQMFLGTSRDQFNGNIEGYFGQPTSQFFIDPDAHIRLRTMGMEHLKSGQTSFEYEAKLRTLDGREFWALLSIAFIEFDGKLSLITSISDITTHKLAADVMRESAIRYRHLIESAPFPIIVAELETGKVLFANERAAVLFGLSSKEEAAGKSTLEAYVDPGRRNELLGRLIAGETVIDYEVELRRFSGSTFWALISSVKFEFDGKTALLTSINDISVQRTLLESTEESHRLLQTVLQTMPQRVFWKDRDSRYLGCNPAFAKDAGLESSDDLIGKTDFDMGWKDQAEIYRADDKEVMQSRHPKLNFVEPQTTPSGDMIWLETSKVPLFDLQDNVMGIVGVYDDITERKLAAEKLALSARVFSEAHEGILISDANGIILDVNPTFCQITGYSREEVIGRNPNILKSGRQSPEFYVDMWRNLAEQGFWHGEVWNRKKDGSLYAELLTISALRGDDGLVHHYIALFSDITQSKHQQQKLELLAHYDVLTRLPNRVLFADRFGQAMARCKRDGNTLLAVCYMDLDGFKQVNDTLGHDAGDQLLVQVAERIKSMLREEDTVSRLGGDEFALLLGDLKSVEQCRQALDRIHRTIAQPYLIGEQSVVIGASSGVALYPQDEGDPDTLLRHADQAMYEAKLAGRNRYQLFDAVHDLERQQHRLKLDSVETALDQGQFRLYYQPKVNLKTGEVFGVEALIRWIHPERGLVPPIEFLPMLESTPVEITLGNWVIGEAMQQLDRWRKAGIHLQVSVNISPAHLQEKSFFASLDSVLSLHPEVPSNKFEIEVLESSVMEDLSVIGDVLAACRDALGVNIALDDFGTGYSSLTHLRHLPANTVKIDQSFVRDMLDDPDDYSIIEGVVGLAHAFRRQVIAEGVETAAHGRMLLAMGCTLAQGYAIARPMPAEDIPHWLQTYRSDPAWVTLAEQSLTDTQSLLLLMELALEQWYRRLLEGLDTPSGRSPHWPIMRCESSHCGRLLERAKKEALFTPHQIKALDDAQRALHATGNQLMRAYLDQKTESVATGRKTLTDQIEAIKIVLQELTEA